jgi:RimJ/RimL family protein N-acetyltransferase
VRIAMRVIRHIDPDAFLAAAAPISARGKRRLFLTTDTTNPTSNAIYARIGFVAEADECHFDFVDAPG